MTIIDFATAAPRPVSFASVRQARLVLTNAQGPSRGGVGLIAESEPVLDPHRLLLKTSELPENAAFLVELVADQPGERLCRVEFGLAGPGDDLEANLNRAALYVAPRASFRPVAEPANDALVWTPIAPEPIALDAGVDADGDPRTIWLAPGDPHAASLMSAIQLAEAADVVRFRMIVRPRVLREDERAAVGLRVFAHFRDDVAGGRGQFLSQWREASRGAAVTAELASFRELDEDALDAIAMALFGRARRRDKARPRGLIVDLRACVTTPALPVFRFIPTADELRARWRPNLREIEDHPGCVTLGLDAAGGPVRIPSEDRSYHLFVIGGTGVGKTTLLRNMIREDLASGQSLIVIDPHGDLATHVRADAAQLGRADDIRFVDPTDAACPIRLDLINTPGIDPELERDFIVTQLIALFSKQMYAEIPEAFGPVFEDYFRNGCNLLMLAKDAADRNLLRMQTLFTDKDYRAKLVSECTDEHVTEFFRMAESAYREHSPEQIAPYITSKLSAFSSSARLRRLFDTSGGEPLSLQAMMDEGRVVIMRLPKGLMGEATRTLGALLMIQIAAAAMGRARIAEDERRPVRIYIDEFQNLANRAAAELLAEIRKYRGSLIMANQSLSQLAGVRGADVGLAVLANCGSMALFRVGAPDAAVLAPYLAPHVDANDLLDLATGDFIGRRQVYGEIQPPLHLRGSPPP